MFYEKESLTFNLLDVFELKQENINIFNHSRNYCALSFRFHADTYLETPTYKYHMKDNYVSYFPARVDYRRISALDDMIVINFEIHNYTSHAIEYFETKTPAIGDLFLKILDCWNAKEIGYKYKCSAILNEIFAECYSQNFKPSLRNSKIQNSVDYIHKNFKNGDLSIQEIAKCSFMSEVYFRKLFKQEYGMSPQRYIIQLRIRHAAYLISTGYYSLTDIARLCGYNDYKYFSVEFKKFMGTSPSEYLYNHNSTFFDNYPGV